MKIAHICLIGAMTDGWNYQENMLAKYHLRQGHDVSVIASQWIYDNKGQLCKTEKTRYVYSGIKMYRIPTLWGNVDTRIKFYKGLYDILEEIHPDLIFLHGFHFIDIREVAKYSRTYKPIVYVDNHSDYTNSGTNWISKHILHGFLWRKCAHIIEPYTKKFYGVLPARVDFLVDVYKLPKRKCELLVMGGDDELIEKANLPEVRKSIRNKYNIDNDDFLIITGGKVDGFKTQTLLLMEAVNRIRNPKVKLIVFGSVTKELKDKVSALTNGNRVQYIGWVQSQDSYPLFAASDLAVFPGRHSVFWEQVAAQGIPMICKYWDGTTHVDLGGNVGFLFQDSVDEIKTNIEKLCGFSDKYKKMKQVAMNEGMKVFSYRDIARRSIE